jgi:hypothetical protein
MTTMSGAIRRRRNGSRKAEGAARFMVAMMAPTRMIEGREAATPRRGLASMRVGADGIPARALRIIERAAA